MQCTQVSDKYVLKALIFCLSICFVIGSLLHDLSIEQQAGRPHPYASTYPQPPPPVRLDSLPPPPANPPFSIVGTWLPDEETTRGFAAAESVHDQETVRVPLVEFKNNGKFEIRSVIKTAEAGDVITTTEMVAVPNDDVADNNAEDYLPNSVVTALERSSSSAAAAFYEMRGSWYAYREADTWWIALTSSDGGRAVAVEVIGTRPSLKLRLVMNHNSPPAPLNFEKVS